MAGAVAGGGALLSASLQVIFDRMASRDVLTFLRGQKLSATLLRKLQMKLLEVQAVLNDAEAKQITNLAVKDWVDELKDAVYDAEDLVDDITTEALRRKMESDSQTQVRNIIFGEGIESRVEEITDTLEYLSQKKDVLGLKKGVGENLSKRWPTTSLVDESGVYGRDVNREEIVKFLLSHNTSGNKISVIALVGMGGIGKTTLAKLVYNDRRVVEFFDLKAWVCVSNEFDLVRITKTILKAIDSGTRDDNDLNLLQHKLEERLTRKKFLLVLDDVWNEDYNDWDSLQTPFNVGLYGSKIIVTTRINKVAAVMHSVHTHHLAKLSSEDCWSLFAKHAFENGNSSPHPKLEEVGKEIVKKCDGLPLAAKTLGGALYSEGRVKEWENVLNSETWDLPNNAILPALILSYYHLPSHLKPCFAYCSIFPKDYQFEKENLILLWMAEGFLQQSEKGKKTMEEIGDGYFYDLLSRSFFQKSGSNKSYFVMHDLMNDLAQLISGKVCVQLKDSKMNEIPEKLRHLSYFRSEYDRFERFEILNEVNSLRTFLPLNLEIWPREDKVSKRTYPYGSRHSKVKEMPSHMGQLKSLQKLSNYIVGKQSETRVGELRELCHIGGSLVIQELQNVVDAKDASEANMVGKQYLDELELEWNRGSDVEQNGADIVLNNLQPHSNIKRLTIYGYGGSRFPDWFGGPSILNMVSLRLWNCKNVSTFPPLGQLPSLKHLYILGLVEIERVSAEFYGTEPSFVSLKALSFQGMPKWKEWLCMGGQGGEFPRLKELYIMDCPQLTGDLPTHLPFLTRLWIKECEQLVAPLPRVPAIRQLVTRSCDISQWKELPPLLKDLSIQNSDSFESLLEEGMLQSNTCLRKLRIRNCSFSRPLCRVCLPITMKSLYIEECKKLEFLLLEFLKCPLPSLAYLAIIRSTCNSLSSFPLGNFPSLTYLKIYDLKGLESLSISISDGDVTSFDWLRIRGCPNLVSIELLALNVSKYSIFNCKNLKRLLHNAACFQSLIIEGCPELIFPIQGLQGLSSLTSLKISDLPNLMSLDGLELQLLTSLEKLEICDCPKLQFLTEGQLPTNLSVLTIQNCPLLKDRCKFWTGEDWHHIAHIPHIAIDDQVL
ncbi:putative disease resistance RPP13-like protein 1 isoform X2 [Vitis vinifera]|uniref:putative disease resistance RPP13-like protein 1 isoform X2 n=1 Tax=Vitis vinifera TaxID=29760 RepID=UPI00053FBB85|nr:putative disease resistance RPP13-like protein 1 isoform X2 [Vitis vinifera]|eukprot:XP_010657762.1 PREDICTED: putative disease resistance RPP13-like protein 1 isoform X2 [Vitis vinifera]